VTRATDPLGRVTTYTFAANGIDLLETRQVNGQTTDLISIRTNNSQHQPLTITDAAGQTTTYTYLPDGRPETVVTPPRAGLTLAQRTTTYSYYPDNAPTGAGRLQTVTGPSAPQGSPITTYTYDGYGRVRTAADADSYTITYDYDALDRPTRVTYPDGTYEETVYNRLDAEKHRDRLGRWTHTFYDALRRVVAKRDPLGDTVTQQWCTCGSLDKLIDPNGNATTWERDVQGRLTREVRADGADKDFVYENTTSRLKQVTDAKNQTIGYQYALDDNLTGITYSNAQQATSNVSFTYDPVYDRLVTVQDGTGTSSFGYHPVGGLGAMRVASVDGPLSDDTISYSYDELGRAASRSINGTAVNWVYDSIGRLSSQANVLGTFSYGYADTTGRISTTTYPNGQSTTYAYLGNADDHRLQQIHHRLSGGATLSKFDYTYDPVGNIKTWSQQTDAAPAKVLSLGYDLAHQLATASRAPAGTAPNRFAYAYDPAGNRTAEQLDDVVTGAVFNNRNQLVTQQPGGALLFRGTVNEPATVTIGGKPAQVGADNTFVGSTPVGSGTSTVPVVATDPSGNVRTNTYQVSQTGASKTFTHDPNGNMTSDGTRTFEWDAENRLVAVVSGTHRSEFAYDGFGRRVRVTEKDNGSVTTDRRLVWCELNICEERDAAGTSVTRRFLGQGVQESGTSYFVTADHLGSVREMTDVGGALRARYDYDPWGRTTKLAGDRDSAFTYTDHYAHAESGLVLAPRRAYDPSLGRWLSPDPLGEPTLDQGATVEGQAGTSWNEDHPEMSEGPNLYEYVQNAPSKYLDPEGLRYVECILYNKNCTKFAGKFIPHPAFGYDWAIGCVGRWNCYWKCYKTLKNRCPNFPCEDYKKGKCKREHGVHEHSSSGPNPAPPFYGFAPGCSLQYEEVMNRGK
jgi:RHS repeat-associated protein